MTPYIAFAGSPLDRASVRRPDSAWLRSQLRSPQALIVPLWQLKPFFAGKGEPKEAGWLTWPAIAALNLADPITIYLGNEGDRPYFAVDLGNLRDPENEGPLAGMGRFGDLRLAAATLAAPDIAMLGQAKALIDWHKRHGFCANCGGKTTASDGGYRRDCPSCETQHFPRTDPVVIMLAILGGDRVLLGRQPRFPPRMFSALAGFVEPGESIEEAVAREIMEEAAVSVRNVRYVASQPWPFPSSLMLGCIAEATSEKITVDGNELAEARWVTRAELAHAIDGGDGPLGVPGPIAIAHQLMRVWLAETK